jgi:hypothetical protein
MHTGKLIFARHMGHLPPIVFERFVARYPGNRKVQSFTYQDKFLCRRLLNTLANANAIRDWPIYADFAQRLIGIARKLHDVNILDQLIPEAGAFYDMDRGYIDFQRVCRLHRGESFFVTRAKRNMDAQRRYSHPTDRSTGMIFDQTLVLQGSQSAKDYPETFRAIRYKDPETGKRLLVISSIFLAACTKCYGSRPSTCSR